MQRISPYDQSYRTRELSQRWRLRHCDTPVSPLNQERLIAAALGLALGCGIGHTTGLLPIHRPTTPKPSHWSVQLLASQHPAGNRQLPPWRLRPERRSAPEAA